MKFPKSRREFLITSGIIATAGCTSSSNNNEENTTSSNNSPENNTEPSSTEPTQYNRKWTSSEAVISIDHFDNNVYASGSRKLFSLDLGTGDQNWSKNTEYASEKFLIATDSYLITPDTIRNRTDGSIRWRGNDRFSEVFEPRLVADNALYAITSNTGPRSRNLTKLDLKEGSTQWEAPYAFGVTSSDYGIHLMQPGDKYKLITKDSTNGENKYSRDFSSDSSLIGSTNDTIVGAENTNSKSSLFGLDAETGEQLWRKELQQGFPVTGSRGRKSYVLTENAFYYPVWVRQDGKFFVQSRSLQNGELKWEKSISLNLVEFSVGMTKINEAVFFGKIGQGGSKTVLFNSDSGKNISGDNNMNVMPLSSSDSNLLGIVLVGGEYRLAMFEPAV